MPRILASLLLLFSLLPFGRAQEGADPQAEYQTVFQQGIDALNGKRMDDGIKAFTRCLELQPETGVCAYNLACAYSLKNELDPAFEWLGKAVTWGYGNSNENIEHAATKDTDLDNLRKDERFAKLITSMKERLAAMQEAIAAYTKSPAVYMPAALADAKEVGVLVVLHDAGSTKDAILTSPWKQLADELGLVLVAPSGMVLAAKTPAEGMAWFSDFEAFQKRYWDAETTIQPALDELAKTKTLDPKRTLIAGEGQGGWIAFNAAVRAPRRFAGVLAMDCPVMPQLVSTYLANAATLKVRLVANEKQMFGVPPESIGMLLSQMQTGLRQAKLDATVERYTLDEKKPGLRQELIGKTARAVMGMGEAAGGK